jgi:hypothetical protein
MPYRRVVPDETSQHPELVEALGEELRTERADGPEDAPLIVEEVLPRSDYASVRVVWDRWAALPPEERISIILDAYQRIRGSEGVQKISSALGLTRAEAKRLGVAP